MADGDPTDSAAEITQLDDRTVREIAAGEVVERPASVVKELVENALDAGANRVAVTVENGGIDGIRVRDDGHGMTPEQLPAAVAEHTTSKLDGMAQLDDGIGTLGFRGEALYTVGAVARLTVRSRTAGQETGAELVVDHGDQSEVQAVGCPVGTTVEVRELFAETPARRKFLKKPATEFDRVNGIVSAYALANPDVAVSLEHDDREVFASPGDGELRSAVLAVYGRDVAESMIDVDGGSASEAGETTVHGVVSDPETTRASRSYVTTFVNGRWVRDGDLRSAVVEAYGGQLAADRYPFAVLFVTVPPAAVDANVHPRKTEVRFDDEADVIETVRSAVRESLLDAGLLRTSAPRGRSAPEETQLDPEVVGGSGTDHERAAAGRSESGGGDGGSDSGVDDGHDGDGSTGGGSTRDRDSTDDRDRDGERTGDSTHDSTGDTETDSVESSADPSAADTVLDAWDDSSATDAETVADPPNRRDSTEESDSESAVESHATDETAMASEEPSPRGWQQARDDGDGGGDSASGDHRRRGQTESDIGGLPSQHTLTGGTTDEWTEFDTLPRLRLLGQYDETYLVCETDGGLVLVDQHAADERVNYERLRRAVGIGADGADGGEAESSGTVQALAEPVAVPLTAREAALFERFRDALAAAGFHAERAEGDAEDDSNAVHVTAVPAVFDATLDPELLRDTLVSFAEDVAGSDRPVEAAADDLLADLACYPSITGNTSLTPGSVTELLAALDECENPYACPHGRPVIVRFDATEIEDRFERDYPGHAGRRDE